MTNRVTVAELDALVMAGRITGYTLEDDSAYLRARVPTLTYRMYADGPESHRNLGEFSAAMAYLDAADLRLSRVHGAVRWQGAIWRTRQLCLTAAFETDADLERALETARRRFVAAPRAAPGSWRYPDLRVTGASAPGTAAVHGHHWPVGERNAVVLTVEPEPPAPGATSHRLAVLPSWLAFLAGAGREIGRPVAIGALACSVP